MKGKVKTGCCFLIESDHKKTSGSNGESRGTCAASLWVTTITHKAARLCQGWFVILNKCVIS